MKKSTYLIVLIGFFLQSLPAWAGSYDDFFMAVRLDNPIAVRALLRRGFDPNTLDPNGTPALIKALEEKSYKVAEVLTEHAQIQPDLVSLRDENALMLAALRGQEDLIKRLLAKNAQVNKSGWTALHYAATGGHAAIAAVLVRAGADLDATSPNGSTPLMMAAMYGNSETVKLLLGAGADASLRNQLELSAEDFARMAGRDDSLRIIRDHRSSTR